MKKAAAVVCPGGCTHLHKGFERNAASWSRESGWHARGFDDGVPQEVRVMLDHTHSPEFVIVSAKDIAERAHEIYVERGYADGFDRDGLASSRA